MGEDRDRTATSNELSPADERQAREWATALAAAGIRHRLVPVGSGYVVRVPSEHAAAARLEIERFEAANVDWPPQERPVSMPTFRAPRLWASALPSALLVFLHWWIGPFGDGALARAGACSADALRAGEWWRVLTALTLHSGWRHLCSNVLALLFLAHAVCGLLKAGLGWFLIVAAGACANLCTGWLGRPGYLSVGASSAVFGALGILVACGFVEKARRYGGLRSVWSRAWVPVTAGLGLLAFLGAAPQTDLAAHAFGFVFGGLLAVLPALCLPRALPEWADRLLQLATLLAVLGAWMIVLRRGVG